MKTYFSGIGNYKRLGSLIIVSGASGTGKSTICQAIMSSNPDIEFSVSCTTRKPREGEKHGKDYFFIDSVKFDELIKANEFVEYAVVYGNYYGTLKTEVLDKLRAGRNVLLDIDVQGAMSIKQNSQNDPIISKCAEFIFILPPSLAELEKRLRARNTETEESVQKRLSIAKNEISHFRSYNYFIVNDDLNKAISDMQTILDSFKYKTDRLFSSESR